MIFLVCFIIFATSVCIESLNPRSVNVALETVLEFDGKHNYRDVKAIDKLQDYLSRIKKILGDNDVSRRHLKKGLKFRDFLKTGLQTIISYDDNDLLDVVAIANNEIRKYHYKGCKFYELVEDLNMRRAMANKLLSLNELTAKELRAEIQKAVSAVDTEQMSEKKKKMLDYLDSFYITDDIKSKMEQFLIELEQFRKRSKRANLSLVKVIKNGLRSVLFDHYTNLNANARKEIKNRLEIFWRDVKKPTVDVWRVTFKTIKEKPFTKTVTKKTKHDLWKIVSTKPTKKPLSKDAQDLNVIYPKDKMLRKKEHKKKEKKNKVHFGSIYVTDNKHEMTIPKIDSSLSEVTKDPKHVNKRTHHKKHKKHEKLKKHKLKTTAGHEEEKSKEMDPINLKTVPDSVEITKKRLKKKDKHKQKLREHRNTETTLKVYFKRHKTEDDVRSNESLDTQSKEKRTTTESMRKNIHSKTNDTVKNITSVEPAPNMYKRIDNIEKVLDEIKTIVLIKNKRKDKDKTEKKTVLDSRKRYGQGKDNILREIDIVTPKAKETIRTTEKPKTSTTTSTTQSTTQSTTKSTTITESTTQTDNIEDDFEEESTSDEDDTEILADTNTKIIEEISKDTTVSITTTTQGTTKLETSTKFETVSKVSQTNDTKTKSEKVKNINDESNKNNLDLEHMFNETIKKSDVDNVINRNADENKEMNEKINKTIEGHIKKLYSLTPNLTKPGDINFDDPFDFKGLKDGLNDDDLVF